MGETAELTRWIARTLNGLIILILGSFLLADIMGRIHGEHSVDPFPCAIASA